MIVLAILLLGLVLLLAAVATVMVRTMAAEKRHAKHRAAYAPTKFLRSGW